MISVVVLINGHAQDEIYNNQSNHKIGFSYSYGQEIFSVSEENLNLLTVFFSFEEPEVVDFRTVTFSLHRSFSEAFSIGFIFKDGERYFRKKSPSNNMLKKRENEYSDYYAIGLNYKKSLFRSKLKDGINRIEFSTKGSLSYIHLNGFEQIGTIELNKFKEKDLKSVIMNNGLTIDLNVRLFSNIRASFFYEPFSVSAGLFGFGIGFNEFGLTLRVL